MKNLLVFSILLLAISCQQIKQAPVKPNTLTAAEQQEGWQLLFEGESVSQWTGIAGKPVPSSAWVIAEGELVSVPTAKRSAAEGGDIITREQYTNFEFKAEFKFNQPANSGIKYFIQDSSAIGFEYQIINQPEGGPHELADLYDLIHSETAQANPDGEWNQAHIIVNGNHVEHRLNNRQVLVFDRNTEDFTTRITNSKFKDYPGFGSFAKGYILLQDHGGGVSFRDIKIKVLP